MFFTKYFIALFCFQIYEARRKLFMYNVWQKFKIQNTIAIAVLVYNITIMEPNVPNATSHQQIYIWYYWFVKQIFEYKRKLNLLYGNLYRKIMFLLISFLYILSLHSDKIINGTMCWYILNLYRKPHSISTYFAHVLFLIFYINLCTLPHVAANF